MRHEVGLFLSGSVLFIGYILSRKRQHLLLHLRKSQPNQRSKKHSITIHESQIGQGQRNSPIVVAGTTAQYRELCRTLLRKSDIMLEIGSAHGVTCRLASKLCKKVVGIDKDEGCHRKAVSSVVKPNVSFYQVGVKTKRGSPSRGLGDGYFVENLEEIRTALGEENMALDDVTVLLIDIAGTIALTDLVPVLNCMREELRPRVTLVKSIQLQKLKLALKKGEAFQS